MCQKAVLRTLCYADVFDWPLTRGEVGRWMKKDKKDKKNNLTKCFKTLKQKGLIDSKNSFYFLMGRERIVKERMGRGKYSLKKLKIAIKIAQLLKLIPWVKLVGVTGGLAVLNAKKEDDIDFLIITSAGRLWLTRLLLTVLVSLTGRRRLPQDKNIKDKICLNMFLSEEALEIKPQDLYTAHEVCQMKVLWERDGTYRKFLMANKWVKKFLPNALLDIKILRYKDIKKKKKTSNILVSRSHNILDGFAKKLQLSYMKHRRTTEAISDTYLRFHPQDARSWVLAEYQKRVEKLKI